MNSTNLYEMRKGLEAFAALNVDRCEKAFGHKLESDWSEAEWGCALAGEVGELCNLLRKKREGMPVEDSRIAEELGDVLAFLVLTAERCGIDLAEAAASKFNAVSVRVGYSGRAIFDFRGLE